MHRPGSEPWWASELSEAVPGEFAEVVGRYIVEHDLGPAAAISISSDGPCEVGIRSDSPTKAHVLSRWLDHLTVAHGIVHRYPRTSPTIRLNVRGLFGHVALVTYAQFEDDREPEQFRLLQETHSNRGASFDIRDLLASLRRYETEAS